MTKTLVKISDNLVLHELVERTVAAKILDLNLAEVTDTELSQIIREHPRFFHNWGPRLICLRQNNLTLVSLEEKIVTLAIDLNQELRGDSGHMVAIRA